jgi:hypothetical protein
MKDDEVNETYRKHGRDEKFVQNFAGNPEGKEPFG